MQVYRIFNKVNNKSYIGITKWTFNERYPQGKWWKWTHSNHLILAVEKYGLNNFVIEILEPSINNINELIDLEEKYIKLYNSFIPNGYNLTRRGGKSSHPTNIKEYELIDIYGNLYKIFNLSKFCRQNKLNYGAMLNMVSGLSYSSQGFALSSTPVEKIYNKNYKWNIENILTKESFRLDQYNILEWSKFQNMKIKSLRKMLNGKIKVFKNWKLQSTILDESYRGSNRKYKNIKLINLRGEEIIIDNIYRFCLENNLERGGFYKLINKKSLIYKGFRLPYTDDEFQEQKSQRLGKKINFVSPSGKIIEIKNIGQRIDRQVA